MEPDREIGLAPEAEREMRVVGIGADCPVEPLAEPVVLVGERLQPLPHRRFELRLVEVERSCEEDHQAAWNLETLKPLNVGANRRRHNDGNKKWAF